MAPLLSFLFPRATPAHCEFASASSMPDEPADDEFVARQN